MSTMKDFDDEIYIPTIGEIVIVNMTESVKNNKKKHRVIYRGFVGFIKGINKDKIIVNSLDNSMSIFALPSEIIDAPQVEDVNEDDISIDEKEISDYNINDNDNLMEIEYIHEESNDISLHCSNESFDVSHLKDNNIINNNLKIFNNSTINKLDVIIKQFKLNESLAIRLTEEILYTCSIRENNQSITTCLQMWVTLFETMNNNISIDNHFNLKLKCILKVINIPIFESMTNQMTSHDNKLLSLAYYYLGDLLEKAVECHFDNQYSYMSCYLKAIELENNNILAIQSYNNHTNS